MKRLALIMVVACLMGHPAKTEPVRLGDSLYETYTARPEIQILDGDTLGAIPVDGTGTVSAGQKLRINCQIVASADAYWSGSGSIEGDYKAQAQSSMKVKMATSTLGEDNHDVEDVDSEPVPPELPDHWAHVDVDVQLQIYQHTVQQNQDKLPYRISMVSNAYASYKYHVDDPSWAPGKFSEDTITVSFVDNGQGAFTVDPSPLITCPQDMTVAADPGTEGAVVEFVVSATDNSESATLSCNWPSGSLFPVGTTTVKCTATDDVPLNVSTCTFTITVVSDPAQAISDLIDTVEGMNLQQGIDNSLDAKLDAASNALDDLNENNDVAAINSLQAFINAVEAQRENKITNEQADDLVAAAQEVIDLLSGS